MIYDLIIIGGGPAGITAGIYAARKKLKTLIITKDWGGQINRASEIHNWPGTRVISGMGLIGEMTEHMKEYEIEIRKGKEVIDIDKKDNIFTVRDEEKEHEARTVIIASGKIPRTLDIPGEDKFRGKGVCVCSTCDAPMYKDKEVAVIGGGNAGCGAAIDLLKYAKKIYVLEFLEEMKADPIIMDKLMKSGKVECYTNVAVKEIKGKKFVEGLVYENRDTGKQTELNVAGVFISVGMMAKAGFAEKLVELNQIGEIVIDKDNYTKTPGLFAAGDISDIKYEQIVIAAGEGAKAALAVTDYLKKN